jgi:hypothetical protein
MLFMRDAVLWSSRKKYPLKIAASFWIIYSPIILLQLLAAPNFNKIKLILFYSLLSVSVFLVAKGWCYLLRKQSLENYRTLRRISVDQIRSSEIVLVKKPLFFYRLLPSPVRSAKRNNSSVKIGVVYGGMLDKEFDAYLVPNPRMVGAAKFNVFKFFLNPIYFVIPCEKVNLKKQRKSA